MVCCERPQITLQLWASALLLWLRLPLLLCPAVSAAASGAAMLLLLPLLCYLPRGRRCCCNGSLTRLRTASPTLPRCGRALLGPPAAHTASTPSSAVSNGVGQPTRGCNCSSAVCLTFSQAQEWQARHEMMEAKAHVTQATALQAGSARLTYCCAMAATRGSPASSCDGNGNKGK